MPVMEALVTSSGVHGKTYAIHPELKPVHSNLGSTFWMYRSLISKALEANGPSKSSEVKPVLDELHSRFQRYWIESFAPGVEPGYRLGSSKLSDEFIQAAAGKQAGTAARQINEVSDKAFAEGFNAAVNKGWDRAVAWERVSKAYGVDAGQMRRWITGYPTEGYHPDEIPATSHKMLEKMLLERSDRIAGHETWVAFQNSKYLEVVALSENGIMPQGVKKTWTTASDELVCPSCSPLDGETVDPDETFMTDYGEIYAPPMHINCRCDLDIEYPAIEVVTKRMGADEFDRDSDGRFARYESRGTRMRERPHAEESAKLPRPQQQRLSAYDKALAFESERAESPQRDKRKKSGETYIDNFGYNRKPPSPFEQIISQQSVFPEEQAVYQPPVQTEGEIGQEEPKPEKQSKPKKLVPAAKAKKPAKPKELPKPDKSLHIPDKIEPKKLKQEAEESTKKLKNSKPDEVFLDHGDKKVKVDAEKIEGVASPIPMSRQETKYRAEYIQAKRDEQKAAQDARNAEQMERKKELDAIRAEQLRLEEEYLKSEEGKFDAIIEEAGETAQQDMQRAALREMQERQKADARGTKLQLRLDDSILVPGGDIDRDIALMQGGLYKHTASTVGYADTIDSRGKLIKPESERDSDRIYRLHFPNGGDTFAGFDDDGNVTLTMPTGVYRIEQIQNLDLDSEVWANHVRETVMSGHNTWGSYITDADTDNYGRQEQSGVQIVDLVLEETE